MLAAIFEFLGALLMGSSVSKTMRKGIADVECFDDNPGLLIYGMTCVILSVAIWLLLASYLEMPVSTTHSCVGGIIGMTLMARGSRCIIWNYNKNDQRDLKPLSFDDFPWLDGVAEIAVSWLLSPIASGLCAAVLYALTKYVILEGPNPYLFAKVAFPLVVFLTVAINTCFIIIKGTKGQPKRFETHRLVREAKDGNLLPAIEVGCYVGLGAAGLAAILGVPLARSIDRGEGIADFTVQDSTPAEDPEAAAAPAPGESSSSAFDKMKGYIGGQVTKDTHRDVQRIEKVTSIHKNAKLHDAKAESFFRFVQVFTAIVASFSHGANDVANSVGPFAAIVTIYKAGGVTKKMPMGDDSYWILSLGAFGIVIGLALYGYKILHALGGKICKMTPSRGICIELGAAMVIIMGSRLGWPLSTTHCQVGATVGVACLEGVGGINWYILMKTVAGWVLTLIIVGFTAAAFTAQGAAAPMSKYPAWANMN